MMDGLGSSVLVVNGANVVVVDCRGLLDNAAGD